MEKISIIIPIYNVEAYLVQCLESVRSQTYRNLEIILIDDGSTDGCGQICDAYQKKDSRIIVVHTENQGISRARNHGLTIATGELISFVDSDDCININMIQELFDAMHTCDSDIAVCGFQRVTDITPDDIGRVMRGNITVVEHKAALCEISFGSCFVTMIVAWGKLYKKKLFRSVKYPSNTYHEDVYVTYQLLYNADKISVLDTEYYLYRQRENSVMATTDLNKILDLIHGYQEQLIFYEQQKEMDFLWNVMLQYKIYLGAGCRAVRQSRTVSRELQEELNFNRKMVFKYIKYHRKSYLNKAGFVCFAISPWLFTRLRNKGS